MKSLKMFPNLPEIYICYALFYMGGNQKPSRESLQGDTLWCQKKTAQFLGKTQTEYFIKKQKVQHYERYRKQFCISLLVTGHCGT